MCSKHASCYHGNNPVLIHRLPGAPNRSRYACGVTPKCRTNSCRSAYSDPVPTRAATVLSCSATAAS